MDATQLRLFRDITLGYFAKVTPDHAPVVEEPYLAFGRAELLDYTSLVEIRGEYEGCLYLTSPGPLLESLLAAHGEGEVSERTREDMCRELSNVLSGNASQAFGGNWRISVPRSLLPGEAAHELPPSAFVLPFRWRGARSLLVVGLSEPEPKR